MNTTFRPRPIPSRPEELAMSLVCRWGGVSVEMGLGERIPASLWDAASKDLFRKNLTQEELHATLILDQKSSEASKKKGDQTGHLPLVKGMPYKQSKSHVPLK